MDCPPTAPKRIFIRKKNQLRIQIIKVRKLLETTCLKGSLNPVNKNLFPYSVVVILFIMYLHTNFKGINLAIFQFHEIKYFFFGYASEIEEVAFANLGRSIANWGNAIFFSLVLHIYITENIALHYSNKKVH